MSDQAVPDAEGPAAGRASMLSAVQQYLAGPEGRAVYDALHSGIAETLGEPVVADILQRCVALLCELPPPAASFPADAPVPPTSPESRAMTYADVLCEYAHQRLHTGQWSTVAEQWRDLFSLATCLKLAAWCALPPRRQDEGAGPWTAMLKECDMATMLGGPAARPLVDRLAATAQDRAAAHTSEPGPASETSAGRKRPRSPDLDEAGGAARADDDDDDAPALPPGSFDSARGSPVPAAPAPSLETFLTAYMAPGVPVVIRGAMDHWPALTRWRDPSYLDGVAGLRTVPVERGNYMSETFATRLMPVRDLLRHIHGGGAGGGEKLYLAQYTLFDHVPALARDVATPDYCSLGEGEVRAVNAWLGPGGTVTPLHYDPPFHNLLCQVVGRKYVRLYSPDQSDALYPHPSGLHTNTSRVDLDRPDAGEFPLLSGASFQECVIGPGEMLYVPPKWWHYVRSLSPSFSVSYWWD
ncbi:unnamed protein product [Pedinophyceae sp. YPF-701]|nr:unnamed protein product [Pedinophyceae sp. YPF-701]